MMNKEGSTKIVTFMTPGAGVLAIGCCHISQIVKMHYFFFKSSSLLPCIYQTNKYIAMMIKEGSTQIVNFMIPGAWVLVLGRSHMIYTLYEYVQSSTLSIYSTLIAIVLWDYDAAFLYHC